MPKIVTRLTDKQVENARPQKKNYKLSDGEGLTLLVRPTGTKVGQHPYTLDGKRNIYTIGRYQKGKPGHVGLQDARMKRYEIRDLIEQGIDPNQNKLPDN